MRVVDASIAPGETRFYRLSVVDRSGATRVLGQVSATRPPGAAAGLTLSAGPNPVRERAAIVFSVPAEQDVRLAVFDIRGRVVQTLFAGRASAGTHAATWEAHSPAGVYFVRLVTEVGTRTERILLVR
jgi:hypothetical protein